MNSKLVMRGMIGFYICLFFLYLFGPLIVMSITAFNTPNYPTAFPFEGFTLDWFPKLWNDRNMMEGLRNSFIIEERAGTRGSSSGNATPRWRSCTTRRNVRP